MLMFVERGWGTWVSQKHVTLWKSYQYGLDHLILAKLCGQLVRNHVSLERPVHKVHCHREFIPGQFTR